MNTAVSRPGFAPLGRDTMQERVYQELRQALMRGYCPPGEVLIVRRLSDQFRTSHMPVRDALARLVAEQALEVLPSRSVAVPVLSRERWRELQEVRELLESRIAALSATRISASDIATLAQLNRDMHVQVARRDAETYLATNWRFHFALYAVSGRAATLRIIEGLWLQVGPTLRGSVDRVMADPHAGSSPTLTHHDDIVASLQRRDVDGVSAGVASDLRLVTEYQLPFLPETTPPARQSA